MNFRPYDGDAQGDSHLDLGPDERYDRELAARDRAAEHAGVCATCDGDGEVRWLACPPDPQTEESAVCPSCRGDGAA